MNEDRQEKKIPAVGQRWRDNDQRCDVARDLVLVAEALKGGKAAFVCDVYVDGKKHRRTTVLASRLKPTATGYRYAGEGAP
jgi:hypothetical protein